MRRLGIAACFGGLAEHATLAATRIPGLEIRFIESRSEIMASIFTMDPVFVLFPPNDSNGVPCAPLVDRLREQMPEVRTIVVVDERAPGSGAVQAVRSGSELLSFSDPASLRRALGDVLSQETFGATDEAAIDALLGGLAPPILVEILVTTVRSAHQALSVSDLALHRGVSRRTLSRLLRSWCWPPAVELIEWGRLLRAALLAWREYHGVGGLVSASGFSSAHALRIASLRRLGDIGGDPSQLRPLQISVALRRRLIALSDRTASDAARR